MAISDGIVKELTAKVRDLESQILGGLSTLELYKAKVEKRKAYLDAIQVVKEFIGKEE